MNDKEKLYKLADKLSSKAEDQRKGAAFELKGDDNKRKAEDFYEKVQVEIERLRDEILK